ncbi:MAG: AGE family epimerase/isomerase [Succinivibrio sp.]
MFSVEDCKKELKDCCLAEARNILDFWLNYIDRDFGGFYSFSDFTGNIVKEHGKGVLLHARILWAYAYGYRILKNDMYRMAAEHCYKFIRDCAVDRQSGGVYWFLDYKGMPTDTQKHVYNQSFVIYGLSEYYLATGDKEALDLALELFSLIEQHAYDSVYGGYREAYDKNWNPIENKLVCDTAEGVLSEKSMNTHLHILEAFTKLYEASHDETVQKQMAKLAKLMIDKVVNEQNHFGLFYTREWDCCSHDVSFGHDIEGSWLLDEAADQISDKELSNRIREVTTKMAEITARYGSDRDGATFNEFRDGHLLDTDRIWWVQAESMIGYFNAYQKTGNKEFLELSLCCFEIIRSQLKDGINGEWFWKVDRYGNPYKDCPKVEPWKCPYHNGRACLEMYKRIDSLLSAN